MKSRVTLSLSEDGQIEIRLNEAGRDELVKLLRSLDRDHEQFHLGPAEFHPDCAVSEVPYREMYRVLSWGKVLLRPDDWDREKFPHVVGLDH